MNNLQVDTKEVLGLFDTNKEQRKIFIAEVVQNMREGNADPLKVHLQVKAMEEIITGLTSTDEKKNKNFALAIDYKNMLLEAAEKHGKKFTLHNAEFSIKEVGTVYDWTKCEDPELNAMLLAMDELKEKIKAKQDFLKTLSVEGLMITKEESGDTFKVYPPAKSSTTSVAVSLK